MIKDVQMKVFQYYKDLDENLTQKTEEPKSSKGNLTPPPPHTHSHTHTVNMIEP